MRQATKAKALTIAGIILGCMSFALTIFSIILIKDGAFPPEGTGSLGHVGMIIAGIIAGFLAIILGSLTVYCVLRGRTLSRSTGQSTA